MNTSKIKRIYLELHNFSFSHSLGKEYSKFIGRTHLISRLKSLIVNSSSKKGVYLITGNRGVGKTFLIEKVANTIKPRFLMGGLIIYLVSLLFITMLMQYFLGKVTTFMQHSLEKDWISPIMLILGVICAIISLSILYSIFNYGELKKAESFGVKIHKKQKEIIKNVLYELILPPNLSIPSKISRVISKSIAVILMILSLHFIVSFVFKLFCSKNIFTCIHWYFCYLLVLVSSQIIWSVEKYKMEKGESKAPLIISHRFFKSKDYFVLICCAILPLVSVLVSVFVSVFVSILICFVLIICYKNILVDFFKYSNFLFLRINFGDKISNERDVLRIIARSLLSDYKKYTRKSRGIIIWKLLLLTFCIFITTILYRTIYLRDIVPVLKQKEWFKESTQNLLDMDSIYIRRIIIDNIKDTSNQSLNTVFDRKHEKIFNKTHIDLVKVLVYNNLYYKEHIKNMDRYLNILGKKALDSISKLTNKNNDFGKLFLVSLAQPKDTSWHIFIYQDYLENVSELIKSKSYLDNHFESFNKTNYFYDSIPYDIIYNDIIEMHLNSTNNVNSIMDFALFFDKKLNKIYNYVKFSWNFLKQNEKNSFNEYIKNENYHIINYGGIFIFLSLLGIVFFLQKFNIFTSHRTIIQDLEKITEAITNEISREEGVNVSSLRNYFNISRSRRRNQILADELEIEKELHDILEKIQCIPFFMFKPQIVIIFDELDKIEPELSKTGEDDSYRKKGTFFSLRGTRDRQSIILKLLSNMKYFLTTAEAKFIFIAGREMYDIYLADYSDRNNHFGSIFNDVIYVPSFLSDHTNDNYYDPTALTEEFVCRKLIPESFITGNYNLTHYREYLSEYICMKDNTKINKIIAVLQQFIIYLSHLSKGAPKKIGQIFEEFIDIHESKYNDDRQQKIFVKYYENTTHFLSFDYYDQYAIGLTSYLVSPIFYKFIFSNIKEHSDKLLLSSLYCIDHIYKYHNLNFSQKNLEVFPEMIEVNKAPELRSVINGTVDFLTGIHIRRINNGFYDYKFTNMISQEITFVSKTYETFSATFNFSLDESLALKQHYRDLLSETIMRYNKIHGKEYIDFSKGKDYVQSIVSIQVTLGDLHFFDDELEEAGIYYRDALHDLNNIKNIKFNHLVIIIRTSLKMCLIYERRGQYDLAYILLGKICGDILDHRNIDVKNIGLKVKRRNEELRFIVENEKKYHKEVELENLEGSNVIEEGQIAPEIAQVKPLKFKHLTPQIYKILFKSSTFEGLRIMYLPFLAKLQILEKSHYGGIKEKDIQETIGEFNFFTRLVDRGRRYLLITDFYLKLGEILYYKNQDCLYYKKSLDEFIKGKIQENNTEIAYLLGDYQDWRQEDAFILTLENNVYTGYVYFPKETYFKIYKSNSKWYGVKDFNTKNEGFLESPDNLGLEKGMYLLNVNLEDKSIRAKKIGILSNNNYNYIFKHYKTYDQDETIILARIFSNIGDNKLKDVNNASDIFSDNFLTSLESIITTEEKEDMCLNFNNTIEEVLLLYAFSSRLYKKSYEYKTSAFQLNKMLHVMIRVFKSHDNAFNRVARTIKYGNIIARIGIDSILRSYNMLNIFEINKRKKNFEINSEIQLKYIQVDNDILMIKYTLYELNEIYRKKLEKILEKELEVVKKELELLREDKSEEKKSKVSEELEVLKNELELLRGDKSEEKKSKVSEKELEILKNELELLRKDKSKVSEKKIEILTKELEVLTKELEILTKELGILKKDKSEALEKESEILEKKLEVLKKELELLREDKSEVSEKNSENLKKKLENLKKELENLKKELETLMNKKISNIDNEIDCSINYSPFIRIRQLYYKAKMNFELFKKQHSVLEIGKRVAKLKKIIQDEKARVEVPSLIADSIFCFKEIIRLGQTINESYILNHSFMASVYDKLTEWTYLFENALKIEECNQRILKNFELNEGELDPAKLNCFLRINHFENLYTELYEGLDNNDIVLFIENTSSFTKKLKIEIKNLLGEQWKEQISGYYDSQRALYHYYRCKETHTGGKAYKEMIDKLFYTRDDYNDQMFHFNIALERRKISTNEIKERIEYFSNRMKISKINKPNNFS